MAAPGGPSKSEGSIEGPYVRYVSPDGDGVESRVEYDMDDEDEEWLARFNGQVSKCHSPVAWCIIHGCLLYFTCCNCH